MERRFVKNAGKTEKEERYKSDKDEWGNDCSRPMFLNELKIK